MHPKFSQTQSAGCETSPSSHRQSDMKYDSTLFLSAFVLVLPRTRGSDQQINQKENDSEGCN
jgi:hypothetical protein